jgi:hypothetical protein
MPSFPRSDVSAAVAIAIGLVAQPSAASSVTGLTIRDVGSNSTNAAGGYSSALDGRSGAFRLSSGYIDVSSYAGTELWTGDAGTGTVIGGGTDNPPGSFSTGFSILDGANWVPYTLGDGFQADISGGVLSITSLDWAFTTGDLPPGHLPSQPEELDPTDWTVIGQ